MVPEKLIHKPLEIKTLANKIATGVWHRTGLWMWMCPCQNLKNLNGNAFWRFNLIPGWLIPLNCPSQEGMLEHLDNSPKSKQLANKSLNGPWMGNAQNLCWNPCEKKSAYLFSLFLQTNNLVCPVVWLGTSQQATLNCLHWALVPARGSARLSGSVCWVLVRDGLKWTVLLLDLLLLVEYW